MNENTCTRMWVNVLLDGHTFINWEIDLIESLKALAFTK